jgi:hypothetical protein
LLNSRSENVQRSKKRALNLEWDEHITLYSARLEQLSMLARAAGSKMPDLASIILGELGRAHVLAEERPE